MIDDDEIKDIPLCSMLEEKSHIWSFWVFFNYGLKFEEFSYEFQKMRRSSRLYENYLKMGTKKIKNIDFKKAFI